MTGITYYLSKIQPFIGSQCIYKDSSSIRLVKLVELNISEIDISLILENQQATGFKQRNTNKFEISCNFELLEIYNTYMRGVIVNWILFTDKAEVEYLIDFAKDLPSTQDFINKFRTFMKFEQPRVY